MLDVILQILSILGIILLVLLALLLVVLLLVLFFPITYRVYGEKEDAFKVVARARWLFGLLRVGYRYPEPGRLLVKCLWFTLFDKKIPGDKTEASEDTPQEDSEKKPDTVTQEENKATKKDTTDSDTNNGAINAQEDSADRATTEDSMRDKTENDASPESVNETEVLTVSEAEQGPLGKIQEKIEKIKYTIRNIYDKIKKIWENISYYIQLLQEENTKQLFNHICLRIGKILKSIRPRHIKADIVFGTGSPDTTGYAYGVYGMLCSTLGPKVIVTPDFEQAVFKGTFDISGHITIWVILINAIKLLFDRKLHLFIEKIKAGTGKETSKAA